MRASLHLFTLSLLFALQSDAVPPTLNYAGQVAVNGQAFDGQGLFKFALINPEGNATYWSNDGTSTGGSEPQDSVSVAVNGGLYSILLGNSAIPGMSALDPSIFQQQPNLRLRVWFNDGVNGFQQLSPDRPFASVPYAFSAGSAQIEPGSISRSMLAGPLKADLNASISLNRLSPEVLAALQVTPSISTQPFARYDRNTGSAQIEVTGRGYDLAYQWLKNGQPIAGANGPVMELTNPVLDDNDTYAVRVTNSLGEATSQAVTLQNAVGAPGPPLAEANTTEMPRSGLVLWLDAKDVDADGIADNLPDGTQIQTWADKSGNDCDAMQDSLVNRPYIDDFFGNDNPTLRFAGSQLLVIPDANVSVAEFYMVFSATGVNQEYMDLLSSSLGNKPRIRIKGNQVNQHLFGRNPTLNGTDRIGLEAYDQIHVLKIFPTNTSNTYFEDMILGATSETGGELLKGSISEVILYDRRLDDNESANLINHLKSKWSIQPSSEPNSADDLFLHWKFEPETDSYYGVFDHSGNARGAIASIDHNRFVDGVDGKAFHFDGANDSLHSLPPLNSSSTLSMWLRPELDSNTGLPPDMAILSIGSHSGAKRISWGGAEGALLMIYENAANYQTVLAANAVGFKPGWNHLVIVIPEGQTFADVYLNGVKQPTNKEGDGFSTFNCPYGFVGRHDLHPRYHGAMDEVRLYTRSLSEAEIQSLYNAVQTPIVRTAGEHNATVGTSFSLSLAADNSPTTYLAEGLPAGLSLNITTGQITGTLSQPGYHRVFVKAMNEHGTGSDTIAIVARPQTDQHGWPVDIPDGSDIPQNGLVLWLDANDVDADGEFDTSTDHLKLANWADKAGMDHNATQANAFRQPTIRSGQISEKPNLNMLVFDGNQSLEFPSINHCRTLFWVMNKGQGFDERGSFIGKVGEISQRWADMQAGMYFYVHGQTPQIRNGLLRLGGLEVDITVGLESKFEYTLQIACLRTSDIKAADLIGKQGYEDLYFTGNIGEMLIYDRALQETEIDTVEQYLGQKWGIALAGDTAQTHLTDGLVAHLPFDETTGVVANDVSGNGFNAALVGYDGNATWVPGKIGGALKFDGDEFGTFPRPVSDFFTVSFWMKSLQHHIQGGGAQEWKTPGIMGGPASNYGIMNRSSKIVFRAGISSLSFISNTTVSTGQWCHVAVRLNKPEKRRQILVNGLLDKSASEWDDPSSPPINEGNWEIGRATFSDASSFFIGELDDLRIYNEWINIAKVQALYDLGSNPLATSTYASPNPTFTLTPATNSVTTAHLTEQILKYLKPEITTHPQPSNVYSDSNHTFSITAEGKYLTYQWKKNGADLPGETNATLVLTDANATLHDGNYSVMVSNDFGNIPSSQATLKVKNPGPTNGLAAWWKFDEKAGTTASDFSGNGRSGTLFGAPTWTHGILGGALKFNGTDSYIKVGGYQGITGANPRTTSAWVKTTSTDCVIFAWGQDNVGKRWTTSIDANGTLKTLVNGGEASGDLVVNDGQWHNVAVVVPVGASSTTDLVFYVDGVQDGNVTAVAQVINTMNDREVRIGENPYNGIPTDFFEGLIDDVRIYDRALSAAEVQALYNLGQ
jgi:hypothetical protein